MKVLFFEPYAYQTPHFETCLELMQEHINAQDEVIMLGCDSTLPTCDLILNDSFRYKCSVCRSKRKNGLKLIEGNYVYSDYLLLDELEKKELKQMKFDFSDLKTLMNYKINDFDLGYGVASSIISYYRDPNVTLDDKPEQVNDLLRSSYTVYLSLINQIRKHNPDIVYLFNGRFATFRPVIKACEHLNVNYKIHERGSNMQRYAIYNNHMPHNIKRTEELIHFAWNSAADHAVRNSLAEKFYLDRANAKAQSWVSFVDKQERGKLPEMWDAKKKNIVIFNSSEDEFASIGDEWINPHFPSQIDGIRHVVECMEKYPEYHVYLRIHPNLSNIVNDSVKNLLALSSRNFTVIPAESKVSTYDLILSCEKIITFGSTAGAEATFWNKPSILLGSCFYQNLNVAYVPNSSDEVEVLLTSELLPKEKTGALMYGFYLSTFGIDFKHYNAESLFSGNFKGSVVQPGGLISALRGLKKKLK
jgi:hypothetical protein